MGKKELALTIHPTALVHPTARIGKSSRVWAFVQIGEKASIGRNCVLGNGVYVDRKVKIGNGVWIQNKSLLYQGTVIGDNVFIGPGVCFTNDKYPRAGTRRNMAKQKWKIGRGATIGANATILPDISIGSFAVVAAGAVVTKSVSSHAVVSGNPAKVTGAACFCGRPLNIRFNIQKQLKCAFCGKIINRKHLSL